MGDIIQLRSIFKRTQSEQKEEERGVKNKVIEWTNNAHAIIAGLIGEDAFQQKQESEFQDALSSNSGFLDGLGSIIQKAKSDFRHPQKFTHKDFDCQPRPVGGAGFAKIVSNPKFPGHEFFREARYFSVRLRHNNLVFTDDTMMDIKVTSLKFKDSEQGGDLDLILYSGKVPPYYNSPSFQQCYDAYKNGADGLKVWMPDKPCSYYGMLECLRRNPKSYYDQRYYSHVTYHLTSKDSNHWLTRIRLIPCDERPESGRLRNHDQENAWKMEKWASDSRPENYLRKEYYQRFRDGPVIYRLQMQYRNFDVTDPHVLNPCCEWCESNFPWIEVAIVALSHALSPNSLAKTNINLLTNPLQSFRPVGPREMKDFCSLVLILREFHGITANSASENVEAEYGLFSKDELDVIVRVKTGDMANAGTDSDIYITLIGSTGRTNPINIDTPLHDDFEAGQTDTFPLRIPDIGDILAVRLEMRSILPNRQWFVEHVTITMSPDEESSYTEKFPFYLWVTSANPTVYARSGTGILVQCDQLTYSLMQRKYELEQRRMHYVWEKVDGLPSRLLCNGYDNLPRQIKFTREKQRDLMEKYLRTLANSGASAVTSLFETWDIFKDYDKLLTNVLKDKKMVKKVAEIWKQDEEFGRQMLNGPHPLVIRRLERAPDEFLVMGSTLSSFIDSGCTLQDEIMNGHVYFLDYPELAELQQSNDYKGKYVRYFTNPECYLYASRSGQCRPLAIAIPKTDNPTKCTWYTPKDTPEDWLLAKMWVREADAQVHHVVSRHLKTHLLMEVFAMAVLRNLPSCHPVFKILMPHLRYTIAINLLGRQSLYPSDDGLFARFLAVGGEHDRLLQNAFEDFNIIDLQVPRDMLSRGVADPEKLQNYYYRDDALKLWHCLNKYIRTVMVLHYRSSENVRGDGELQEWLYDMRVNGLPGDHGLPEFLHDIFQLAELLTSIVFTASCRNAALTLGMMDYYAYVPNIPTMMLCPPSSEKGTVTMDSIRKMLPSRGKAAEIVAANYTISRLGKDEVFLGQFPEDYFDDDATQAATMALSEELDRIAMDIKTRNDKLDIPYTYLLPGLIPNSVSM